MDRNDANCGMPEAFHGNRPSAVAPVRTAAGGSQVDGSPTVVGPTPIPCPLRDVAPGPMVALHSDLRKLASERPRFRDRRLITQYHAPLQSAHCERMIGTTRRERLDHVIVFGEQHGWRLLAARPDGRLLCVATPPESAARGRLAACRGRRARRDHTWHAYVETAQFARSRFTRPRSAHRSDANGAFGTHS
jgi:hypothetical protein